MTKKANVMITLTEITINKYKSFFQQQTISFDPKITALVGMNESGKTAFLEALAKVNYFVDDQKFKFDDVPDYPRRELKNFQKDEKKVEVMKCTFKISDQLLERIQDEVGDKTFKVKEFSLGRNYGGSSTWYDVNTDESQYIKHILDQNEFEKDINDKLKKIKKLDEIPKLFEDIEDDEAKSSLNEAYEKIVNFSHKWENRVEGYIVKNWLEPNLPKFWYYDQYYSLPSRINLTSFNPNSNEESDQTAQALFEMAEINLNEILQKEDFERFKAELESTSIHITEQLFKYWSTNQNLDIKFDIDTVELGNNVVEKHLDIRIFNNRYKMSLPLEKRSKGFNWFFSFIIWFGKIQADKHSNYILLLDEPGLNLHASAQADLLDFIEDLSDDYQVVYTTHSPFMIDSDHLERVRTIVETGDGSIISESIQEKDPRTLFPLQAALGYDIAQNLFISKNNLLVEGPADLIYLTTLSSLLESENREGLKDKITIVPVGGLDKVSTFIALLSGSKLNIVCLLDNFTDMKGKQKVDDLIKNKIIKEKYIRFFGEFVSNSKITADIEDMFTKEEYLNLYNEEFGSVIKETDLDFNILNVVAQITDHIGKKYNHYRPANLLARKGVDKSYFSEDTLTRFENMFKEINKLF